MSRRGIIGILIADYNRQLKAQARAKAEAERAMLRSQREAERAAARQAREALRANKEAKKAYEEYRSAEVASLNNEIAHRKLALQNLLEDGQPAPPTRNQYRIPDLNFLQSLVPGAKAKYQLEVQRAEARFTEALQQHQRAELEQKNKIDALRNDHKAQVDGLRKEIDALESACRNCDPSAISEYYGLVLQRTSYPPDFPQRYRVAFVPESKQVVVECELPPPEVVPGVAEYRY